jgi:hypothetical protein
MSASKPWLPLLLAALAALPAASFAANDLDEVVVQGDRHRLDEMRKEIVKLEDKFYARFNELSTDNQFDFYCSDKARTGTAIRQKICRPRFVADAQGMEGSAWLEGLKAGSTGASPVGSPVAPARIVVDIKNKELMRLMVELVEKDPELRDTLVRYGDMKVEYTALLTGKPQKRLNAKTAEKP